MQYKAIVIGVSAGGMDALRTVLPCLKKDFSIPVIVIQHSSPDSDDFLARYLNERCQVVVKEADEKEKATAGVVYIAPSNYHLLVEEDGALSLSVEERVNYARPSIDVLFETAADAYGSRLIGVILTGANDDGSRGLQKIKECGGLTIVQDPATAEVDSMPRAAMATTKAAKVLPLAEIGRFLNELAGGTDVGKD